MLKTLVKLLGKGEGEKSWIKSSKHLKIKKKKHEDMIHHPC